MDLVNVGEWPEWELSPGQNGRHLIQTVYGQIYEMGSGSRRLVRAAVEEIENAEAYKKPDSSKVTGEIVKRFAQETDFFVFAQIGGPVTQLDEMFSMEDFMVYSLTNTDDMHKIAVKVMVMRLRKPRSFLTTGLTGS